MAVSFDNRITRTPGVCGGKARIAGHRVRVLDVVSWTEAQGMTPEQIVASVPSISLPDVQAALSYYQSHRDEIEGEIQAERVLADEMSRRYPSLLAGRRAGA